MPLFVPPLEEAVDPQLVDPSTIKSIPKMLEQIRFLGQNRPSGHLTHLIVMSQVQHEEVALTALQTLLNIKDPRVPPQMLPLLAIPGFSSQRRFLILKIIMETRSVLEPGSLEQVLVAEKDVIVKSGLVKVYARTAGADGVATLKACLADGDPRVRANTIEVIEEQGIPGCEPEIAGLLKDPENRVKVNSAKFLVKLGHPEAFTTLRTMLGSSEVWLRDSVIFALGEIGDQASLTLLKAALKDPSQGIRLSVLKALAKVNNGPARDVLQGMGGDADPIVAQVARGLFEKIKDTPLRTVTAPKPAAAAAPPVAPPVVPPPVAASPATRSPSPTSPAGADLELPSLDGLTPVRPGAPTPLPVPVAPDADEAPSLPPLRQAPAPGGEATDDEGPALPPSKPSAPSAPIARPGPLPEAPADDAEPPALPPLKPATGRPPTASVAATRSPQLPPAASEEPPVAAPPPSPAGEEEIPLPPMKPAPRRPAPQPAPPPVGEEPPAGSEPPPAAPAEEGPALPSLPGIGSAVARPATPHAAAPPQPLRAVPLSAPSAAARPAASGATVSADGIRFAKPRSAEVYARLCSDSPDDHQAAMKDLPFIMGDDQMILLTKAATNPDDGIRLAVAKLVSRKRGPQAIALMQTLAGDPSPLVTSFAQKALTMMK
ncbi:MAG: hypothetical protein GX442_17910 [Candidatus Riflebacteria bacterium]|nr:hypothetical protein [Candidatus Riflebacteria bacterium]